MRRLHKNKMTVLSTVLLILLLSSVCFSQIGVSSIKGIVTEAGSGKPIKGAKVYYKLDDKTWGVVTDEKGQFTTTKRFADGMMVSLIVSAEGYIQDAKNVIAVESDPSEVYISLKKSVARDSEYIRREFTIQHREPGEIYSLIKPYLTRQSAISEKLRTISISETVELVMKVEKMIQQYDTPLKQIWLEVFLIHATSNGKTKPEYPEEIKGVVKKLESLFSFGKYEIVGRADAMGLENARLSFSSVNRMRDSIHSIFKVSATLGCTNGTIRLEGFHIADELNQNDIMTSINIKDGETVILGASGGVREAGSLITVVTARIMK
jgi:hypothetical protein